MRFKLYFKFFVSYFFSFINRATGTRPTPLTRKPAGQSLGGGSESILAKHGRCQLLLLRLQRSFYY